MKIIVCIKQVPDTSEVRINPKTNNLIREGVPSMLNPSDENAIEEALKIRDAAGGSVTLLSMGPSQAAKELEHGLGMGADSAILLCDRRLGGSDTLATGYALSNVIKELGFDLVLCGNEAVDGCTGQVGPSIAVNLNVPAFTHVNEVIIENGKIQVKRDTGAHIDIYETDLPALACILKGSNNPRPSKQTAKKVEIMDASGMDAERIGLDGSPTRVMKVTMSDRIKSYVDIDSSLSCEERIDLIINGGIEKKSYKLIRGDAKYIAGYLLEDDEFFAYIDK